MSRARSLITLGILALLLVSATAASLTIGSQPRTCTRCHGQLTAAMNQTAHASVDCYACHVDGPWDLPRQKLAETLRMYPGTLIRRDLAGPARQISRQACLACHGAVEAEVSSGRYVRIDHRSCVPAASCDGCHASTAHGSVVRWSTGPVMERCVGCHEAKNVSTECVACHVAGSEATLNERGPWQVAHGPQGEKTHGMGDLSSCDACHAVSTFDTAGFCVKCHGVDVPHPPDFGATHGESAMADIDSCRTCHDDEAVCDACHRTEMPHPADFTPRHSSVATSSEDASCLRCHVNTDCKQCHLNHLHPGGSRGVPVPWDVTDEGRRPVTP